MYWHRRLSPFVIRLSSDAFKKYVYKIHNVSFSALSFAKNFQEHLTKKEIGDARFKNHENQKYSSKQYIYNKLFVLYVSKKDLQV